MLHWVASKNNFFPSLVDENKENVGIFGIKAPILTKDRIDKYKELKHKGYYFVGISSYQNFPDKIINPGDTKLTHNFDIFKNDILKEPLMAWCTCAKKTNLPDNLPQILLPESDLLNPDNYGYKENTIKKYDFIYNCQKGIWQNFCRNWTLGKKCVEIMCKKYNLKVLLVGGKGEKDSIKHSNAITTSFLQWNEFKKKMSESKYVFLPNVYDASPRVAAEGLIYNMPLLENKNIVGGWHYINKDTGMDFDENDFEKVLTKFLKKKDYKPRDYFIKNYGLKNASRKLYEFINKIEKPLYRKNKEIDFFNYIIGINYNDEKTLMETLTPLHLTNYKIKLINIASIVELNTVLRKYDKALYIIKGTTVNNNSLNHYLSLYLEYDNDWSMLYLGGDYEKETTDYLYLDKTCEIKNVPALAVNKYDKSHKGYVFKEGFANIETDFNFKIDNSITISFREIDYNIIYKYSDGYFRQIANNKWQEIKNGSHWAYFYFKNGIYNDPNRKISIKFNDNKCYFKNDGGKWNVLFNITVDKKIYRWNYSDKKNYFIYVSNKIWKEYKNNKLFAIFEKVGVDDKYIILFDKTRKLYVKLYTNVSEFSYNQKDWHHLSRGVLVTI